MLKTLTMMCLSLAWVTASLSQKVVTKVDGNSTVDWERQVVVSTGTSGNLQDSQDRKERIDALERAKKSAGLHLLQAVAALRLDSGTTVSDRIQNDPTLRSRLRGLVQQYVITDTRPMSDLSVEVDVELPLRNGLLALFMRDVTGAEELRVDDIPRSPLSLLPWPECRTVPAGVELVIPSQGLVSYEGKPYTGLIVDASGLGARPALLPEIKDAEGRQVYGQDYVDRDEAVKSGIVLYKGSLADAKKDARVGPVPFIVCGERATGNLKSGIVVSVNDAVLIHAAAKRQNFLKTCNVIVVVN